MKNSFYIKKTLQIAILLAFCGLGGYAAVISYENKGLVQAILGIAVLFLGFRVFWKPSNEKLDVLLVFPKNIKYLAFACIATLLFYWILVSIIELILSIVK
jgi:hypothetical protein